MKYKIVFITIILLIILFFIIYSIKRYFFNDKGTLDFYYYNMTKTSNTKIVADIKQKILVYQSGSYKKIPKYAELCKQINKKYCEKYGYDYIYYDHPINQLPPYWIRVDDLNNILNMSNPVYPDTKLYDIVMYMDLDAIFYDFSTSIESILNYIDEYKKYDIFIGKDPNIFSVVNTGSYIFRNTIFSRKIASIWLNMCINTKKEVVDRCAAWIYNEKTEQWNCPYCIWAGKNYEQGSFEEIWSEYKYNIAVLKFDFLSNRYVNTNSYVLHLMDSTLDYRYKIFLNYLNKLN